MSDAAAQVRSLLLPLGGETFVDSVDLVSKQLDRWSVDEADRGTLLQDLVQRWRDANTPPKDLKVIFASALEAQTDLPSNFSTKYFSCHKKLQTSNHLLSFEQARGLLSNTLFVKNLLNRDGMSAAQIALILNASQNTTTYTWRHIQVLADALQLRPTLDARSVVEIDDQDRANEPLSFVDAGLDESIEILAGKAFELGYPGDMTIQLRRFLDEAGSFESAFAIVLHVNALITQYFDHPLSQAAYEFAPRGSMLDTTMKAAHPSYQASESPYLNIAKGTFAFDSNWAWGRKPKNRRKAHALVDLLESLSEMAYQPRRELASWLRQWLIRMERVRSESFVFVDSVTPGGAERAIARICESNTATQGVLEQRLLDLAVSVKYHQVDGWLLRGVGDAVNASNVSKKKLGDLEAENPSSRKLHAFEPHGGKLTNIYVERHRNTLKQVLGTRLDDLTAFGPASSWEVSVTFIAHDTAGLSDFTEEVLGFQVHYEFVTYHIHFSGFDWSQAALEKFVPLVVEPVSERWTPDSIKLVLNDAMSQ